MSFHKSHYEQTNTKKITFTKEHGKLAVILDYANPHHLQIYVRKTDKFGNFDHWLEVELALDKPYATVFGSKENITVVEGFED